MRQWFTNPEIMCQKHLLGEHVEHHMFWGHFKRKRQINGYIISNCVQPKNIKSRHDLIVKEMIRRGINHNSPIYVNPDISYLNQKIQNYKIDVYKSTLELISRCKLCKQNALNFLKNKGVQ